MARSDPREQLRKLEQQHRALEQKMKQKRAVIAQQERKNDTRRKIILGGLIEKHCQLHPDSDFTREVQKLIGRYVTGDTERALFDLPPKAETAPPPSNDRPAEEPAKSKLSSFFKSS